MAGPANGYILFRANSKMTRLWILSEVVYLTPYLSIRRAFEEDGLPSVSGHMLVWLYIFYEYFVNAYKRLSLVL